MSKITKAMTNPKGFLADAWKNVRSIRDLRLRVAHAQRSGKKIAVLVGFSAWKTWMKEYLPEHEVVFLGHSPNVPPRLLREIPTEGNVEVFAWSYKYPPALEAICHKADIPLTFVEDGFIRSFGLGATHTTPLSLVFDNKAMHFDRKRPSQLEGILATYDFASDPELMRRAETMISELTEKQITKYNGLGGHIDLRSELGLTSDQKVVLVVGQVEDDLSLAYGLEAQMSGNDLVLKAATENPDAVIMYRPHPESRAVKKSHYSNPDDVAHCAYIVPEEASLHACFKAATQVYAMTSLAGFEALLHGLPVKTFGCPFYAGWGATEDVDPIAHRRTRNLNVKEIFAAAYILYPKYWHPVTREQVLPEDALRTISVIRGHADRLPSTTKSRAPMAAMVT